jgi:hypothetical protein
MPSLIISAGLPAKITPLLKNDFVTTDRVATIELSGITDPFKIEQ